MMPPLSTPPLPSLSRRLADPIADMRQGGKLLRIIAEMERTAREAERAE